MDHATSKHLTATVRTLIIAGQTTQAVVKAVGQRCSLLECLDLRDATKYRVVNIITLLQSCAHLRELIIPEECDMFSDVMLMMIGMVRPGLQIRRDGVAPMLQLNLSSMEE